MSFETYKGLSYVFQQENSEFRNVQGIDLVWWVYDCFCRICYIRNA